MDSKATHSVKWRLMGTIALVMSLIMGAFLLWSIYQSHLRGLKNLNAHGKLLVSMQAVALARPMWDMNTRGVQSSLSSLAKDQGFIFAKVIDTNGALIAEQGNVSYQQGLEFRAPILIRDNKETKELGKLLLTVSQEKILSNMRNEFFRGVKLALGLLFMTMLTVYLAVSYYIGRPVQSITQIMRKMSDHNQDIKVPIMTRDEFGTMAMAFNAMSKALRDNFRLIEARTNELENMNSKLEDARKIAEAANKTKSQFLANMSHELRTPLNAILGYAEILKEEAAESGNDYLTPDLNRITLSAEHLLELINDVLDISKIEAGKMAVNDDVIQVKEVVKEVEMILTPLMEKGNNRFLVKLDDSLDIAVLDVYKLKQSLINLLSNAAKFTTNGTVQLIVKHIPSATGDKINFSVQDSGIGMTNEQMSNIFAPFIQADNSTTRKYGGTGLGLAITKRLCDIMGGTISVKSELGKGSTFTISFPLKNEKSSVLSSLNSV